MYFDWEGRIISRFLINLLTYYKAIWNIINAIMIVGIVYFANKIINPKNKKMIFLLTVLIILLMNILTFSQIIVWIAGNITYLFVIPIILYYFYQLLQNKEVKQRTIIFLSILNIIMTMFVEHMGLIIILGNLFLLIREYIKTKRINKTLLLYCFFSIIGLLTMILSPGSLKRLAIENQQFNELSIIGKMIYNFPNLVYYTYLSNFYLFVLITIGNYYLNKKINNKIIRKVSYLYLFLYFIIIFANYFKITFMNQYNFLIQLYFIIYTIISIIFIYLNYQKDHDLKIPFFYFLGIMSNIVMLISPTWGFRTGFATYIFLCITYIIIIDKNIKEREWLNKILSLLVIIMLGFYSILYISIARQNYENKQLIKQQKEENRAVITIKKYPEFVNCNINPNNDYHFTKFKQYYKINSNTKIKLIENNWEYFIFYHK